MLNNFFTFFGGDVCFLKREYLNFDDVSSVKHRPDILLVRFHCVDKTDDSHANFF